jgi:hypothetical protein
MLCHSHPLQTFPFSGDIAVPHSIIQKLNALMEEDVPNQIGTDCEYLGKVPTTLSDPILDQIDAVIETARRIFGTRCAPTIVQMRIMCENGYPLVEDNPNRAMWKRGVIRTPKGLIRYW